MHCASYIQNVIHLRNGILFFRIGIRLFSFRLLPILAEKSLFGDRSDSVESEIENPNIRKTK